MGKESQNKKQKQERYTLHTLIHCIAVIDGKTASKPCHPVGTSTCPKSVQKIFLDSFMIS